jgi:hypothetical protein
MGLFDLDVPGATVGWQNVKAAHGQTEAWIKAELEKLWQSYEPFADDAFRSEFASQPEPRFWEMYLTTHLLRLRRRLIQRSEIASCKNGDKGPDIGIRKSNRVIWVEAIAPAVGDDELDKVPQFLPAGTSEKFLHAAPRRQVELRITSALYTKALVFRRYRKEGIIGEKDSRIVAISAGQFSFQAVTGGLPYAVSAVYPFGEQEFTIDRKTAQVVKSEFTLSDTIERKAKPEEPIPRTAFQGEEFKDISGIIWSRSSIGNFSTVQRDLSYIHNQRAARPIPRGWIRWREEYYPLWGGTRSEFGGAGRKMPPLSTVSCRSHLRPYTDVP